MKRSVKVAYGAAFWPPHHYLLALAPLRAEAVRHAATSPLLDLGPHGLIEAIPVDVVARWIHRAKPTCRRPMLLALWSHDRYGCELRFA